MSLLENQLGKSQIVISNIICISVNVKNKENFYVKKVSGVCIYKSVFYLWLCNLEGFLENIVPRERTSFPSYGSFINKTDRLLQHYPKSLSSSAENIRYFHYRGGFDTKTGISFTVSRDEYQELKKAYLSVYLSEEEEYQKGIRQEMQEHPMEGTDGKPENRYGFVFDERVTPEVLAEEERDYLGEIFQNKIDDYTFLAYEKVPTTGDGYYLDGVLCNDDMNEMVFFAFKDGVRKE